MEKLRPTFHLNFRLGKILRAFVREEEGQSTTEYILILAVVVMIAMKFKDQVGKLIGTRIDKLQGDLSQFDNLN
jgi:Flp pilus assembly pilin Flp